MLLTQMAMRWRFQGRSWNLTISQEQSTPVASQRSSFLCQYSYWADLSLARRAAEPTLQCWLRGRGGLYSSALLRWKIVIARNFEDGDMVFSPVPFRRPGFFVTLPREGLHLRARNPIAEAQRSLLNCWMVNGYKFRWNMAFCSRIIIDTAWGHLIFSVFSAFRVFTFQEKPRTDKLKNWKKMNSTREEWTPDFSYGIQFFSFSVFPLLVPQI